MAIKPIQWKDASKDSPTPEDQAMEATLRSLKALGGEVGSAAASREWRWSQASSLGFDLSGGLAIPTAWAPSLDKGPAGQAGRALARGLIAAEFARRSRKDGPSASPALDFFEVVQGVSIGEALSGAKGPAELAAAVERGIDRAAELWQAHHELPEILARFRLREKILDARAIDRSPRMTAALEAFEGWDDGLPKDAAELAAGRALALAACGLEDGGLDRGADEPLWRAARKMLESAKAEFGIPTHYGQEPQSPLAPRSRLRPALAGGNSGSQMFERADGLQYVWEGIGRREVFDHPLAAARWILDGAQGPTHALRLPEGVALSGMDGSAQAWAARSLARFNAAMEAAELRAHAKEAPTRGRGDTWL